MIKDVLIRITGRVQGVGFRAWAVRTAQEIGGISGWIHNDYDGSVLVLMRGEETAVDKMLLACQTGPRFSHVEEVEFISGRRSSFLPEVVDGVFRRA